MTEPGGETGSSGPVSLKAGQLKTGIRIKSGGFVMRQDSPAKEKIHPSWHACGVLFAQPGRSDPKKGNE
jgi:hypothetical protein